MNQYTQLYWGKVGGGRWGQTGTCLPPSVLHGAPLCVIIITAIIKKSSSYVSGTGPRDWWTKLVLIFKSTLGNRYYYYSIWQRENAVWGLRNMPKVTWPYKRWSQSWQPSFKAPVAILEGDLIKRVMMKNHTKNGEWYQILDSLECPNKDFGPYK